MVCHIPWQSLWSRVYMPPGSVYMHRTFIRLIGFLTTFRLRVYTQRKPIDISCIQLNIMKSDIRKVLMNKVPMYITHPANAPQVISWFHVQWNKINATIKLVLWYNTNKCLLSSVNGSILLLRFVLIFLKTK